MSYNLEHVKLITAMRENKVDEAAEHLLAVLHEINSKIEDGSIRRSEILENLKKIEKEIAFLRQAFPLDDPHGHRSYHEKIMQEERNHIKIKQQIVREVVQKGILILITIGLGIIGLEFGYNFIGMAV